MLALNRRAALMAQTLVPDGGGGFSQSWQIYGHAWVRIHPIGPTDRFIADVRETRVRHRIVLRSRGDIAAGQRIAVEGRVFRIHAVPDRDPSESWTTLLCEELPGVEP